jgi:hypothetical protein
MSVQLATVGRCHGRHLRGDGIGEFRSLPELRQIDSERLGPPRVTRPRSSRGGQGEDHGEYPTSPHAGPEAQPLLLAKVADVHQELLRLTKPVALVAEHSPQVCVAGDGVDLSGELFEEQGHFSKPSVDLVSCLTLCTERVEGVLHCYLPGYESSSRPRPDPPDPA